MSVGSLWNRSQPDDFASRVIYNLYNDPLKTMFGLQLGAIMLLMTYSIYLLFLKTQLRLPGQALNLLVCTFYLKTYILDQNSLPP